MALMATADAEPAPRATTPSSPVVRLGTAVVAELVELIVTGEFQPGDLLPPEGPLAERFGVSRTVVRESVKRLQEKGLVVVGQGRGTQVQPQSSWRMLDTQVLSALVDDDGSNGILAELSAVRASLEALMAGAVARRRTEAQLAQLREVVERMRALTDDEQAFFEADVAFHLCMMEASGNRLARNVAGALYQRAMESPRFRGHHPDDAVQQTLDGITAVYEAVAAGDVDAAERGMRSHIDEGWRRRQPDRGDG
jgi:DNA-binding FadR family transcriptional regulator